MSRYLPALAVGTLILQAGCDARIPVGPSASEAPATRATEVPCGSRCILIADARPFLVAARAVDSLHATTELAVVRITGTKGGVVRLRLAADAGFLTSNAELLVTVDGLETRLRASAASKGVIIARFRDARTITISYGLDRGTGQVPREIEIVQELSGGAVIAEARRPWLSARRASSHESGRCNVPIPGTYCGVDVLFQPYFDGDPFGEFQNPPGTGPSEPIHIIFSRPVAGVAVTIADPDFPGNQLVVNSVSGSSTHNFVGDGIPNSYTEYSIVTSDGNVTSIDLIPAQADYVAYLGFSFEVGDSIVVSCTPSSVLRASGAVTCTASSSNPNAALTMSEWRFIGGPGNTIRVNETTTSPTWAGPLATSGSVSGYGTLSTGAIVGGTANVTVTPRNWSSMLPSITAQEEPSTLPVRPTRVGELGNTGLPIAPGAWLLGRVATIPLGGPNAGVWYVTQVPINVLLRIQVNRAALSQHSDFWRRQPTNNPPPGMCVRADVVPFVPVVERHEGLAFEPGSHTGLYRARLNQTAGPATEGLVGMTETDLQANADPVVNMLVTDANNESAKADQPPHIPVYCNFRYF
jgi:hypothetical protein